MAVIAVRSMRNAALGDPALGDDGSRPADGGRPRPDTSSPKPRALSPDAEPGHRSCCCVPGAVSRPRRPGRQPRAASAAPRWAGTWRRSRRLPRRGRRAVPVRPGSHRHHRRVPPGPLTARHPLQWQPRGTRGSAARWSRSPPLARPADRERRASARHLPQVAPQDLRALSRRHLDELAGDGASVPDDGPAARGPYVPAPSCSVHRASRPDTTDQPSPPCPAGSRTIRPQDFRSTSRLTHRRGPRQTVTDHAQTPTGLGRRGRRLSEEELQRRMLRRPSPWCTHRARRSAWTTSASRTSSETRALSRSAAYRRWPYKDLFFGDLIEELAKEGAPPGIVDAEYALIQQAVGGSPGRSLTRQASATSC